MLFNCVRDYICNTFFDTPLNKSNAATKQLQLHNMIHNKWRPEVMSKEMWIQTNILNKKMFE